MIKPELNSNLALRVEDVASLGGRFGSLVPSGYDCLIRVFHPAYRRASNPSEAGSDVGWETLSEELAVSFDPAMHWSTFTHLDEEKFRAPSEGSLFSFEIFGSLWPDLATVLRKCGYDHLMAGVWEPYLDGELSSSPRFTCFGLSFGLCRIDLQEVDRNALDGSCIAWDAGQTVFVNVHPDLRSTLVACRKDVAKRLVVCTALEACYIDVDDYL